jgi:hypothetical protein
MDWHSLFSSVLELLLLAGGLFYSTLVLLSYFEGRGRTRPRFDRSDLPRFFVRVAVWLGVKTLTFAVRVGSPILGQLSEASAEVGEWILNRRSHHGA